MEDENILAGGFKGLKAGDKAIVTGFLKGKTSYRKKLLAMGITPGTLLEVVRMAPLGDPVEIQVRGYLISLRREEASLISVKAA